MRKETAEKLVNDCIRELKAEFDNIADIALHNQEKVLDAFRKNAVQARHFAGSTGYAILREARATAMTTRDGTPSRRSLRTRSAPKAPSFRP